MPESRVHPGRIGPDRTGGPYTRPRPSVHPARRGVHPVHTSVPGIPGSAPAGVYTRPAPSSAVHTTAEEIHPVPDLGAASVHPPRPGVHTLVWATRHLVHTGPVLVAGGVYTGPASVVPTAVLAVLGFMPAGGAA